MADNLFPTGYSNSVITAADLASDKPVGYRKGVSFDYEREEFLRDGMNKLVDCTGIESWQNWCINCLRTERYRHLAYSTDFGIDTSAAMRATSRKEAESILTREISEALLADPYGRTAYINDIKFTWNAPDGVIVSVTVRGIDDVTIDITTQITQGGG